MNQQAIFEAIGEILKNERAENNKRFQMLDERITNKDPDTSLLVMQLEQKCAELSFTLNAFRTQKAEIKKHGLALVSKGLTR